MYKQNDRTNAQLTKYFRNVITNTATNYYKKKFNLKEKEILYDSNLVELENMPSNYTLSIANITILGIPLTIENESLLKCLRILSEREQFFLIEKFIFNRTDKEISHLLGISRQGVTNLKHRLYNKFRCHL